MVRWNETAICCTSLFLPLTPLAHAWGKEGHEIIANIAYRRLSSRTKFLVDSILNETSENYLSPLAAVANWADKVRYTKQYYWSTPLHYVDIRDDLVIGGCPSQPQPGSDSSCFFNYDRDCGNSFCAVGAIVNYTSRLMNLTHFPFTMHEKDVRGKLRRVKSHGDGVDYASKEWALKESLMFITHFVGDIHQPLHSSRKSDKGGNTIIVHFNHTMIQPMVDRELRRQSKWNLHSVWDVAIIERAIDEIHRGSQFDFEHSIQFLVDVAEQSGEMNHWLLCSNGKDKTCVSSWAETSWEDALRWAYSDEHGNDIVDGSTLSDSYFQSRLTVVKSKIAVAGVRLGAVLETIFSDQNWAQ